uniref:HTH_48 domain-containing protein n=1 Tax=Haemonchus contortus TaxID=6289 RepID=A0A7I4YV92_HAECO
MIWFMSDRHDYRHILLHYCRSGHSVTQARNELQSSMGSTAPSLATCYRWYGRLSRGEIHLDEAPRSGRPRSTKTDIVSASVQSNPSQSLRGMERTTSAPRSTIHDILRRRRFRAALLGIIPHTLTESECQVQVDVCRKLLYHKQMVA